MIQGIQIASQGMTGLMKKHDQIANNLANVNTTGYKQSGLFMKAYEKYVSDEMLNPHANREIKADEVYVDYSEGTLRHTGNKLDLAVKGSGFFTIMTPGGVMYTRNGNFSIDSEGLLVTSNGDRVFGKEGYIRVDREMGAEIRVTDEGELLQGTEPKGKLLITDFAKPYRLLRKENSCFVPEMPDNEPVESPGYVVKQEYLETSNVKMVRNMVQMIAINRNFQADQKALQAQDETLDKAVNQVGRVT